MSPTDADTAAAGDARNRQRIDKWMWHARVVRTRTLAKRLALSGKVRLNRERVTDASRPVKIGDVLTIALDRRVLVLRIAGFTERRGSATLAAGLYEDLSPPPAQSGVSGPEEGTQPPSRRPTKKQRRQLNALRQNPFEDG